MWGLGYIWRILLEVVAGRSKGLVKLRVDEKPNVVFLYLLALCGALFKPRWTSARTLPALEVSLVFMSSRTWLRACTLPRLQPPGQPRISMSSMLA